MALSDELEALAKRHGAVLYRESQFAEICGAIAAAVAAEREWAARVCERIADDYNRREGLKYPELKADAETGANECADAIRAGAKEPSDEAQ